MSLISPNLFRPHLDWLHFWTERALWLVTATRTESLYRPRSSSPWLRPTTAHSDEVRWD